MIIGILSDTHDRLAPIEKAFSVFSEAGAKHILHCGDWTRIETAAFVHDLGRRYAMQISGVLGNNDRAIEAFLNYSQGSHGIRLVEGALRVRIDKTDIAVYHGHHKPTLRKLLEEHQDLLCLGHSHKPYIEQTDTGLVINPGSTAFAIPRSKTWQPSIAVFDTASHKARLIYF